MKLRWAFGLFMAIVLSGCTARPMVCMFGYIDETPVIGCVDARTVPGIQELRPYIPAVPSPDPPRPGMIPYNEKHGIHTKGDI